MACLWSKVFATLTMAAAAALGPVGHGIAAPVVFSGLDDRVGPGQPDPNSVAAAAAFNAAAPPTGVITFENLPVGSPSGSLTPLPGVTLLLSGDSVISAPNLDPVDFGYNTTPGGSRFLQPARSLTADNVVFTFASPINSFGFFLTGSQIDVNRLTLTFNDGTPEQLDVVRNEDGGIAFYGFTDLGRSFSSISINDLTGPAGDLVGVDDVRFQAAPTMAPEPGSSAILGGGILALGLALLRKPARRSQPSAAG